jgi:hypothetical protein
MTTSGSYSFFVTRDDIVREALLNNKKIDGYDPIDPVIMVDMVRKLNLICKQWMGKTDFAPGLKVWTRKRGHLFLRAFTGQYAVGPTAVGWASSYVQTTTTAAAPAGAGALVLASTTGVTVGANIGVELDTGDLFWSTVSLINAGVAYLNTNLPSSSAANQVVYSYTATPQQPLSIEAAVLRDINLNDNPLSILQSRDYDWLPSKMAPTNVSDPGAVYYENQLGSSYVYVDVAGCADMTKHIVLTYMEPVQDFVNSTDLPYYPQEWYRPLCWALTKESGPMFNATWTPVMSENFTASLAIAQKKDAEIETRYFQSGDYS